MLIRKFFNSFRRNLIIYKYFGKFLKIIYKKFKSMRIFQKEKVKKFEVYRKQNDDKTYEGK